MTRLRCPFYFHDGGKSCDTCACDVVRPQMPADTRYCLDCGTALNPFANHKDSDAKRCNRCARIEVGRLRREAVLR